MKLILLIIGFIILWSIVSWIINKIRQFIDTRNYKKKLLKLKPQIDLIDVEDLHTRLLLIKEHYIILTQDLSEKYSINIKDEKIITVDQYIMDEASYRRKKRFPSKSHAMKRKGYWRY